MKLLSEGEFNRKEIKDFIFWMHSKLILSPKAIIPLVLRLVLVYGNYYTTFHASLSALQMEPFFINFIFT